MGTSDIEAVNDNLADMDMTYLAKNDFSNKTEERQFQITSKSTNDIYPTENIANLLTDDNQQLNIMQISPSNQKQILFLNSKPRKSVYVGNK